MGPSGAGKTTIGIALAARLDGEFVDADDLHPRANVEKMAAGHPLDDEDRWPWLDVVGDRLAQADGPIVIACSALRRVYRDRLRARAHDLAVVELVAGSGELARRMQERTHFMPPSLLGSQLATLEHLDEEEAGVAVDADLPVHDVVERAVAGLGVSGVR